MNLSDPQMPPTDLVRERHIRVFVSSTFRDMQADRDVLVKKVFPQLRKLCESRAVTWTEVDLRWGITEEQANEGQVLPLCLAEIERSRPYFIGLLGERYGWVPEQISADLMASQPWLADDSGRSVTELEILHGVLNDPAMAERALFYLRDPAYERSHSKAQADGSTSSSNGASKKKLARLKQRIRDAYSQGNIKYAPKENYADPNALADLVLADFTRLIEELYPEDEIPAPLDREARRHEEYARSRRDLYIARPNAYDTLNDHVEGDGPPLVLTGESGCGKTALLANWVDQWRKDHPDAVVIQHYIGSTPDSADWQRIVTRILGELKVAFDLPDELPTMPDQLRSALDEWIIKTAGGKRIVLVLDGLNQLEDSGNAQELHWLPALFPSNTRVLASALPSVALDALKNRDWTTHRVELLNSDDRRRVVTEYLKLGGRTASDYLLEAIEQQPQTLNPLYLRAFLDEIRQFGEHEELPREIEKYLSAETAKDLYAQILKRWIRDYPEARVGDALKLIWAARRGLGESELMDLLGQDGQLLPRRHWTPYYLVAERSLVLRGGLLNFGHDYLRQAVRDELLPEPDLQQDMRRRLAAYFAQATEPTDRKLDELPWLLQQAQEWEALRDVIAEIPAFLAFWESEQLKQDLNRYWLDLQPKFDPGATYRKTLAAWEAQDADAAILTSVLGRLGSFHFDRADFSDAEPLMRRALTIDEKRHGRDHPVVATRLGTLAGLLRTIDRLTEAEPLMRRALKIYEQSYGKDDPLVATGLNNLAHLLRATNQLVEAESLTRRALAIDEQSYGPDHPNVAICLGNLGLLLQDANQLAEAESPMRRSLAIFERNYGADHPRAVSATTNLAQLLQAAGKPEEAELLMHRALAIGEKSYGPDHPHTATALNNLARLLQDTDRPNEAEPLLRRALCIYEQRYGPDHPDVAAALNNLGLLFKATDRPVEAEPLMRRALASYEQSYGPDHPLVGAAVNNLARLLQKTNRLDEAEPLLRRALKIWEQSYPPDHPNLVVLLNELGSLLQDAGRLDEAEPLSRRVLAIEEQTFGKDDLRVAIRLVDLVSMLMDSGRLEEAEPLMRRALAISERCLGTDNPDLARTVSILASLLHETNKLEEAELLYRRALALDDKHPDGDDLTVAVRLDNLASILNDTNRPDEAEPLMRRALGITERSCGCDHPSVAVSLVNLAHLLCTTGRSEEAEPLIRRALTISELNHGPDHPDVAGDLGILASILGDTNRQDEAEPLLRRALAIDEKYYGADHTSVAIRLNNLASLLYSTSRFEEAEPLMRRVIEIFLRFMVTEGQEHPHLQAVIANYAALLEHMGHSAQDVRNKLNTVMQPFGFGLGE